MINKIKKHIKIIRDFGIKISVFGILRIIFNKLNLQNMYLVHKYYENIIAKIKFKYKDIIEKYKKSDFDFSGNKIEQNCKVWIFWWQGIDSLPETNVITINSVKKNLGDKEVIILTKDNVRKYSDLPEKIFGNLNNGKLSITNFSDILRFNLLSKHGGIWIDSTLLVNHSLSDNIFKYSFYTIKHGHYANTHICRGKWSTFFMASSKENEFMKFMNEMMISYSLDYDYFVTYLLIDCLINIAYDEILHFRELIDCVPVNNENVFLLENLLNYPYSDHCLDRIYSKDNYLYKLTYKNEHCRIVDNKNTIYDYFYRKYFNL